MRRAPLRWAPLGAVFLPLLLLFLGTEGCGDGGAGRRAPAGEASARAEPGGVAVEDGSADAPGPAPCWAGVVVSERTADLSAPRGGVVTALEAGLGDRVERGEILVRLDAREVSQELEIARASLVVARAERERAAVRLAAAREELEGQRQLSDIVSARDIARARAARDEAQADLTAAGARVTAAAEAVAGLERQRGETALAAPFDGVVTGSYVAAGERVGAGQAVVRVMSPAARRVRFAVPPACARWLGVGGNVGVEGADGGRWQARVERASPDLDPALRMMVYEAAFVPGSPLGVGEGAAAEGPAIGTEVRVMPTGSEGTCFAPGRTALGGAEEAGEGLMDPADPCAGS